MKTLSALILAGGESSRFGINKALIPYRGTSLIGHIISRLEPHFSEIIISTNNPAEYTGLGLPVCTDILIGAGPLAGIHAGLRAASSDYVFIIACDMPFVSDELIAAMQREIRQTGPPAVVAARNGFIEPFHGFYSTGLISNIEQSAAVTSRSIFGLLKEIKPEIINSPDESIFYNINRPEDLQKIKLPTR